MKLYLMSVLLKCLTKSLQPHISCKDYRLINLDNICVPEMHTTHDRSASYRSMGHVFVCSNWFKCWPFLTA